MVSNVEKKEQIVIKIRKVAMQSISAVVASLNGVTANAVTQLRRDARYRDVSVYVIRNTLLQRIFENTSFLCLQDILVGQNIIAFSTKRPSDAVSVFVNFSKKNENFKIKGASFEGKLLSLHDIDLLSNLPTRDEVLLKLMLVIKTMSNIGKLIYVLRALLLKKSK